MEVSGWVLIKSTCKEHVENIHTRFFILPLKSFKISNEYITFIFVVFIKIYLGVSYYIRNINNENCNH